jgi:nicotinamide-nucleotide amidase
MANAAIISVGNELLNGNTVDTNSNWLQNRLLTVSIPVVFSCAVTDDIQEIKNAIQYAAGKADIILITGGLGPTDDDLTRQAIAEFLGVKLEYHSELFEKIEKFFIAINRPMVEKNKIQAFLPAGTSEIENDLGTAPGIFYQGNKKIIASFPGVPSEMKQMFDKSILPRLKKFSQGDVIITRKIRCIGAGESAIAEMMGDMMNRQRNPLINCTVDHGIITLHIIARAKDKRTAETMAAKDIERLCGILGRLVYGFDEQTLARVVGQKLLEKKKTLAIAESCTGGLIAKMITDIPGSSGYFTYGWVTYSNDAKITQLGVDKGVIERFGAVSSEVAAAMAEGARKKSGADFAISITGIAGPEGGSEQKPVGLVYISIAFKNGVNTEKMLLGPRDRDFIRLRTSQHALNLLRLNLGD